MTYKVKLTQVFSNCKIDYIRVLGFNFKSEKLYKEYLNNDFKDLIDYFYLYSDLDKSVFPVGNTRIFEYYDLPQYTFSIDRQTGFVVDETTYITITEKPTTRTPNFNNS